MATALLLIPGLLCDARLWTAQIEALADVAEAHVPNLGAHDSIAAMAEAVLQQAPPRFALAGFSMGGCVALEIVARAPERVRRLALLSTDAAGIPLGVRERLAAAIAGIEAGGLDAYLADAFPRYVAPERASDRALHDIFVAMGRSVGAAAGARQMRALLSYPGFACDLATIAAPTAVIGGRSDERIPVWIQAAMADRIPGSTLHVIERAAHFAPIEEPRAVSDALREWLGAGEGTDRGRSAPFPC